MTVQEYNDWFKMPTKKQLSIRYYDDVTQDYKYITNDNIVSESMVLEDALCSEEELRYGTCEASCFKIRIANVTDSLIGQRIRVSLTSSINSEGLLVTADGKYFINEEGHRLAFVGNENVTVDIGAFFVISDTPTNDRSWRDLVCYDMMYNILNADVTTWFNSLTFPMTLKDFRDSFFDENGFFQETTTLINDNYVITGDFSSEGTMSGKTIIESICELNGVFGHMGGGEGYIYRATFEYVSLDNGETPSESLALDYYIDGTGNYENYTVDKITGVVAKGTPEDVGTSVGTTINQYIIESNPLTFGSEGTQSLITALTNLLNKIKVVTYRPYRVQTYGNPKLPLGYPIQVTTRDMTYTSYVIGKMMTGIQSLKDTLSASGKKRQPKQVNSIRNEILATKGKVHELRVQSDELYSAIYDPSTGISSEIQQLSNEVVLKVKTDGTMVQVALNADASTGSTFQVDADNISFFANNKMELTANSLEINSTNFKVDSTGKVTCSDIDITGGKLEIDTASADTAVITLRHGNATAILTPTHLSAYGVDENTDISSGGLFLNKYYNNTWSWIGGISNSDNTTEGIRAVIGYFDAYSTTEWCDMRGDACVRGRFVCGGSSPYSGYVLSIRGSAYASGSYSGSSKRIKENVKDISDDEAKKLLDIRTVSFDYKEDFTNQNRTDRRGVIAEEVAKIYPNIVNAEVGKYGDEDFTPAAVNYTEFIPYLIKLAQIQQKEIDELRRK